MPPSKPRPCSSRLRSYFASRSAAPSPNSRRSTRSLRSPPEPSSVGLLSPAIPRGSTQPRRSFAFLVTHAVLARLRFTPGIRRFIDPPLKVLIRDGHVDRRNLRRCGLTIADLEAVLRQHGHESSDRIHLAIFEAKGAISILLTDGRGDRHGSRVDARRSDFAWPNHRGKAVKTTRPTPRKR